MYYDYLDRIGRTWKSIDEAIQWELLTEFCLVCLSGKGFFATSKCTGTCLFMIHIVFSLFTLCPLEKISSLTIWFGDTIPYNQVHGVNMGPIWGRQNPDGPHVGPMNFAIWEWSFVQRRKGSCYNKSPHQSHIKNINIAKRNLVHPYDTCQ